MQCHGECQGKASGRGTVGIAGCEIHIVAMALALGCAVSTSQVSALQHWLPLRDHVALVYPEAHPKGKKRVPLQFVVTWIPCHNLYSSCVQILFSWLLV